MSRSFSAAVFAAGVCFGGVAIAHHSVGINFDNTKAFIRSAMTSTGEP